MGDLGNMESDYDRKFKEMKKYIPFLENMIRRLESTSTSSANPRQAQLDKIRSLRDLLLDKKKRMKMDNLLKCEQVLVNLYAKVEQRDTLPGIKKASEPLFPSNASTDPQKADLNSARSKLQSVAPKIQLPENDPDTLPEIAPASQTEEVCTPGSKEPALFQRRPNKNSRSPMRKSSSKEIAEKKSPQKIVPKRNYTRVLVSPEPSPVRWTKNEDPSDKPLFSRRSPKKSSPQKKEKKKSSKSGKLKGKGLNITLNVPRESIDSLNTGDILSRIIKCPDNDVDIATLRDLRTQILGELKQTGANEDISDLILKSYKKKKKTNKQTKQKEEVEEGELSDSESEAIESIYGSLVVVNKEKNTEEKSTTTTYSTDTDKQARKIQICLVIKPDIEETISQSKEQTDVTDFEMFDLEDNNEKNKTVKAPKRQGNQNEKNDTDKSRTKSLEIQMAKQMNISPSKNASENLLTIEVEDDDDLKKADVINNESKDSDSSYIDISSSDTDSLSTETKRVEKSSDARFTANFYNENKEVVKDTENLISEELHKSEKEPENQSQEGTSKPFDETSSSSKANEVSENSNQPVSPKIASTDLKDKVSEIPEPNIEIPLLNTEPVITEPVKKDVVSEIDILQALKNEILSETIAIPGSEVATPLLHQPKVTKVASAQEIMTKKRISLEKYKQKSVTTPKESLFLKTPNKSQSSENLKKTSLKLTEQEQQRFNFLPLPLDSSDEEDKESTNYSIDDIYKDLAPKSPENNDCITSGSSTPIIIPIDPVKPTTVSSKTDVDMRTLIPIVSPNAPKPVQSPVLTGSFLHSKNMFTESNSEKRNEKQTEPRRTPLLDPRVRRDLNKPVGKDSPIPHGTPPERTPRLMTPNPSMTPNSRSLEMTPSRQSFELDDISSRKHVYAPFPTFEPRDQSEKSVNRDSQGPRWEPNSEPISEERNTRWDLRKDPDLRDTSRKWDDRDLRNRSSRECSTDYSKPRYDADNYHEKRDDYSYSRMDCPRTPVHSFGRSELPTTPIHPFGRTDCPSTPNHPFGHSEMPMTPNHPFGRSDIPSLASHYGRSDIPLTPSHPFGRCEAPMTPNHPFGRSELPMTPIHPFGRSEPPLTPSHPFGRSEPPLTPSHPFGRPDLSVAPMTPSHTFGRSDYQQNSSAKVVKDPRLNRNEYESRSRKIDDDRDGRYYKDRRKSDLSNKTYNNSESYQHYREQSVGRNERSKFNSERTSGRESSVGRSLSRDYENDRLYTRDRGGNRSNEKGLRNYNEVPSCDYQRGQSVGRSRPADDRFQRSSSRGLSDNRNYSKQCKENTLSVKSQSGRSFTIDTSVNTTFQEFLHGKGLQVFEYSFDSRRQRAASVGRALTRESSVGRNYREGSVGRSLTKPSYSAEHDTSGYKRMVNFVRARSMGRELVDKTEKSFKEIKADLKSFKPNYKQEDKQMIVKKSNYHDPRSRKDQYEKQMEKKSTLQSNKKTIYSPRKNYRDPRMQRDQYIDSKHQSRHEDKRKNYGIVYSSDNIARGTILGSGFGVKNYRIPKIKKPVEEIKEIKEHSIDLKGDNKSEKSQEKSKISETKPKEKEVIKKVKEIPKKGKTEVKKSKVVGAPSGEEKNLKKQSVGVSKPEKESVNKTVGVRKSEEETAINSTGLSRPEQESVNKSAYVSKSGQESVSKRTTRRSKLTEPLLSGAETITKTRKTKRAVMDSDSDSENFENVTEKNDALKTPKVIEPETKNENLSDKKDENVLNSSFGLDDLEIFPEHLNADPVLDNISALIADLDNDIDTTKVEEFTKDISFDKMFESIDSPEVNIDESLQDISKAIEKLDPNVQTLEKCSESKELNPQEHVNAQITGNVEQTIEKQHPQPQIQSNTENRDAVQGASLCKEPTPIQTNANSNITSVQEDPVHNSNIQDKKIDRIYLHGNVNNEAVVSTTEADQESLKKADHLNEDRSSTPDSTLDTSPTIMNNSNDEGLPDSTNEKNEMHPDVSSTREQTEVSSKDTEVSSEKENSVSSIGNLLSILQDKSKIKELLSLLGDAQSADTEKIKKKLEKLSEIVSDDDDTKDGTKDENVEKDVNKESEIIKANTEDEVKTHPDDAPKTHTDVMIKMAEDSETPETDTNLNISDQIEDIKQTETTKPDAKVKKPKKTPSKRGKGGKWKREKKSLPGKRVTRSGTANKLLAKPKKPSRELRQLQESIKEMFMKDDILNATGIRMCRLSKLVDEKGSNQEETNLQAIDSKPVVVIEKIKDNLNAEEKQEPKPRKKPRPKPKAKSVTVEDNVIAEQKETKTVTTPKYKPGPKSKTKNYHEDSDPYSFDDSISEATTAQTSELENESETEDDSLASSKSFGSSEVLAELKKKPKRKKRGWQSGIIKKRRKKNEAKLEESLLDDSNLLPNKEITIPDMNCFTDKSYCFLKNISEYPCRLCEYNGPEIVKHYKTDHPHTEIPLSRMNAVVAREAVEQCEDINFQAISKMPTEKYICRFCFEEFGKKQNVLEEFFWHVVSMHTGEYKRLCSECVNVTRCPFNLDIPPPPKDLKGQLIGYICGKCNFTQISLENLKTHVIVRHNDEQTAVYTINLAVMSKKTIQNLMKRCNAQEQARVLRSLRSTPNVTEKIEPSDREIDAISDVECLKGSTKKGHCPKSPVHSKLAFESDDNNSEAANTEIKVESEDIENDSQSDSTQFEGPDLNEPDSHSKVDQDQPSSDILYCPHFKVTYASNGLFRVREYVCCINGTDNHYKTNLLISMKKHVQIKHTEIWDGYCSICKVIVMPQGGHQFKECLQHMLDKHMDNFPVLQETETLPKTTGTPIEERTTPDIPVLVSARTASPQTYINVRPLTDLFTSESKEAEEALPKIQSVVSLGTNEARLETAPDVAPTLFKCPIPVEKATPKPEEPYKYEEMQAEVMSKKHVVILQTMLSEEKLVHIFKCAGRYCSFTTDSADSALLHASTHQRIGGENALLCAYCDYDCKGNAIDLVMHVFKIHGRCPYVCGHCFYRAVATQLVLAHIHRVHGGAGGIVLETATVTPVADDSADMLPREVAVQHYVCAEAGRTCRFKTYTQGKFIEHLTRHTAPYYCYTCALETNHPSELLHHMKTHGLKLYQCTWCVEGGDNEGDFLAHSSCRHPTRQPQAYLRIITNNQKDGGSKTMVLPLAKLNKSSVSTRLVTPQSNTTNPAKEAEKALDMENLIAAMPTECSEQNTEKRSKTPVQLCTSQLSPQAPNEDVADKVALERPLLVTPPPSDSAQGQNESVPLMPVLKTEPIDESPEKNLSNSTVICLDSDEEDSKDSSPTEAERQNVIDLSDDEHTSSSGADKCKKVGALQLFKCNNCKVTFKNMGGFKRHVHYCVPGHTNFTCAHCTFNTNDSDELFNHYNSHNASLKDVQKLYSCGMCPRVEKNIKSITNHTKKEHGLANISVTSTSDGNYVVNGTVRGKPGPKRKLSGGPVPESLPKRVRYGVQDLHNLPQKPILDELAYCSKCEFSTKVRLNLVRHIQQHANNELVPQTAPVNPVPHLETNEKHFDRMINLASSSLELGRAEKSTPSVILHIPPEAANRYPKYVPDRQRHTCGAKGCTYISVDETMLKCHWETLHAGSNDFHCVHCPSYQYLDTSKPLTASRIIAHLKMHDIRLYACSSCTYYHYRKQVLEKHLAEVHKGSGQIMIVREESTNAAPVGIPQVANTAPTMDLKPWKCGLCAFKSMLRPEVIEHCSKMHSTKMQFKCPVCPFRTSTVENVTKHQANSHPGNKEDVFYYYYREGSIPDEKDGTPRWVKQRQKMGNLEPEVKTEEPESTLQSVLADLLKSNAPPATTSCNINLNIVKEEVVDPHFEESMEELCKKYGEICDPNGLKYKCPLCKLVTEDNKETMQSHLYEELQYRKWACSICCYKAFHKTGLNEHMITEHRQNRAFEPIELDADTKIERWVNKVLDHQSAIIESNKSNLAKQKIQVEKPSISTLYKTVEKPSEPAADAVSNKETENLIQAFGQLGSPNNLNFCCPKCAYQTGDEEVIKDHLEIELNKIRWRCSSCWENSQNYHEAQLHSKTCKSSRPGQASRPIEAIRDPAVRTAWIAAVIRAQRLAMKIAPEPEPESRIDDIMTETPENSLLVVRYEERVPTPEVEIILRRKRPVPVSTATSPDSDEERLVIDEPFAAEADAPRRSETLRKCSYCPFATKYQQPLDHHILRHYNLKPMMCCYCEQTFYYKSLDIHMAKAHPNMPKKVKKTPVPSGPPVLLEIPSVKNKGRKRSSSSNEEPPKTNKEEVRKNEEPKLICLICEMDLSETETKSHIHDKPTYFAKKGEVVVKCCVCLSLLPNINLMQEHNNQFHPHSPINYAYFKLNHNNREILQCGHCSKRFKVLRDLKNHHNFVHSAQELRYESRPYYPGAYDFECETENRGESSKINENTTLPATEPIKRVKTVARKSTTKLPNQAVARKSTTKLPYSVDSDSEEDEYSHYGNKPVPLDQFENVTTLMPIFNTMIPLQKLSEIIKISPVVLIKDCKK